MLQEKLHLYEKEITNKDNILKDNIIGYKLLKEKFQVFFC
jgi:hypothetical protein